METPTRRRGRGDRRVLRGVCALFGLALVLGGCRGRGGDDHSPGSGQLDADVEPPSYPGELISTDDIEGSFMARQKLSGIYGDQRFAFDAVMQFSEGTLTVLGLTPFGTKAFLLEQRGTEVSFELLIDREIPFPPEFMLQDIHRAWLWHLRLPWGVQAQGGDESPVADVDGERVRERWSDGKLIERSFERLDGEPPGTLKIEYRGGYLQGEAPGEVVLDNGWLGYQLTIETVQWREL